jgi:hypothetical protein
MPLQLDVLQNSRGQDLLVNGYPRQPGQVVEYLTTILDNSTMTGESVSYTASNITAQQVTTTTYADVNGSAINYVPPAAATRVIYQYQFSSYWAAGTAHSIQHFKFFIDGVEVVQARHNRSSTYYEDREKFEWIIPIGGVANTNTGRQATWTTAKILKLQTRRYAANSQDLYGTVYYAGATSNQFNRPQITIIAIA